jgi:hypothetical protein
MTPCTATHRPRVQMPTKAAAASVRERSAHDRGVAPGLRDYPTGRAEQQGRDRLWDDPEGRIIRQPGCDGIAQERGRPWWSSWS